MEMPSPSPGHSRLAALAGHWQGEETMHPSQWDPEGGTALGRMKSRMILNGFALVSEYEQERGGAITFAGHGVFTFEAGSGLYSLHWFDCLGSPPEIFAGRFEGDILTLAHGGPGMHARMTYDLTDPRILVSRMEMSADGEVWNRLFDGRYEQV
jgi:uncharacterized protein YodC (DUF2158 family)